MPSRAPVGRSGGELNGTTTIGHQPQGGMGPLIDRPPGASSYYFLSRQPAIAHDVGELLWTKTEQAHAGHLDMRCWRHWHTRGGVLGTAGKQAAG